MSLTSYRAAPPRVIWLGSGLSWLAGPVLFVSATRRVLLHPALSDWSGSVLAGRPGIVCFSPLSRRVLLHPALCLLSGFLCVQAAYELLALWEGMLAGGDLFWEDLAATYSPTS